MLNGHKKMSIKGELFKSSILLSCAIVVIFGIFLSAILYYTGVKNAAAHLKQRNSGVNYFVAGYFSKIHNMVDFISKYDTVIHGASLENKEKNDILTLYRNLESSDPDIGAIYSGYADKSLIINHDTPPPGFNPLIRPWYQAAVAARPHISDGLPYRAITDNEWLISISKALLDDSGKVLGVVAIDTSIAKIAAMLRRQDGNFKSSYSFVLNRDKQIIIHDNKDYLGKTLASICGCSTLFSEKGRGKISYTLDGVKKIGYYSHIDAVDWTVVTVIDKNEIITPIIIEIGASVLFTGVIAIVLGWFLSLSLSRRFVTPLLELKNRVEVILAGDGDTNSPADTYPPNEIGAIAADIEKLTESAQYSKNIALQKINRELEVLSTTDNLTRLFNRHKMHDELSKEWQRAQRYGSQFSITMLDIDWFKKINDQYGHQAGDMVLATLGELLTRQLRTTDIISRWGGEEFLVLSPETDAQAAFSLTEKLRIAIAGHQFEDGIKVTVSAGIAESTGQQTIEDIIQKADEKLYRAKQQGRNRVEV